LLSARVGARSRPETRREEKEDVSQEPGKCKASSSKGTLSCSRKSNSLLGLGMHVDCVGGCLSTDSLSGKESAGPSACPALSSSRVILYRPGPPTTTLLFSFLSLSLLTWSKSTVRRPSSPSSYIAIAHGFVRPSLLPRHFPHVQTRSASLSTTVSPS
jgi:hypothetical protein